MKIRYTIVVAVISVFSNWSASANAQPTDIRTIELIPFFSGYESERPFTQARQQFDQQSPYPSFRSPYESRSRGIGPDHQCGNGDCNHGPSCSRVENNYRGDSYSPSGSRSPHGRSNYANNYDGSRNYGPPAARHQRDYYENFSQGSGERPPEPATWQRPGNANDFQPNGYQPSAADFRPELGRPPISEPRVDRPRQTYSSYKNDQPRNPAPNQESSGLFPPPPMPSPMPSHDHSQCDHDH